jgi:NTE family protein
MADPKALQLSLPVQQPEMDEEEHGVEKGMALCLSGGGYRAALFHAGALWRLNEVGLLKKVRRVSSVSGGSITAGALAIKWQQVVSGDVNSLRDHVIAPLRNLADHTLDAKAVISGIFSPGTIADHVAAAYKKHLFGDLTLQDLLDESLETPRFVFNATNVQTGALWRFSKPFMGDFRVGLINKPTTALAVAVAASSAFPPVLSPLHLHIAPQTFSATRGADLQRPPFTTEVFLSDGGVYDNLGLETAFKRYSTLLVSDGGQKMAPDPEPAHDWARHSMRVAGIVDDQVRNLRKRQLISAYQRQDQFGRTGAYWGIRSHVPDFGVSDPLQCIGKPTDRLAQIPTRLARMEAQEQEQLINWGYAICDVALRAHFGAELQTRYGVKIDLPTGFPYPGSWL